ncbi:MAG: nuclear transport factor 2 family protein [Solirubrobacterales bacterium]
MTAQRSAPKTSRPSRSNEEVVRGAIERFNSGDIEGSIAYWRPDGEFHELPYAPDAGTYRGHDGLRRFQKRVADAFDEVRYEIEELIEQGDRVFISVRMKARGRDTGIPIDLSFFSVYEVDGGKLAVHRGFMERDEALRAAGIEGG